MAREAWLDLGEHAVGRVDQHEIVLRAGGRLPRDRPRARRRARRARPSAAAWSRLRSIVAHRVRGRARRRRRSRRRARAPRSRARRSRRTGRAPCAPSTGPTRLKMFSRTRSDVGRVSRPRGAASLCPFRLPAITRMGGSSHGDLLPRPRCLARRLVLGLGARGARGARARRAHAGPPVRGRRLPASRSTPRPSRRRTSWSGTRSAGCTIPYVEAQHARLPHRARRRHHRLGGRLRARLRRRAAFATSSAARTTPIPRSRRPELQYPPEHAHLASRLRRQAPYGPDPPRSSAPSTSSARGTPRSGRSGSATSRGTSSAWSRSSSSRPLADARVPARACGVLDALV